MLIRSLVTGIVTQPETEANQFIRIFYGKVARIRNPATHHLKIWKGVEV